MSALDVMKISRAQGCWLGQLTGDALGSMVEFQRADEIQAKYPEGVRVLAGSRIWNTIAGQPTDDSEMALMMARSLVERGRYDAEAVLAGYQFWLDSMPFDCGNTIRGALREHLNPGSEANGAMMRVSPLGIFGAKFDLRQVAEWARQDAELTHPNLVCVQVNVLFAMAIAYAIESGASARDVYEKVVAWALEMDVAPGLMRVIQAAAVEPPADYHAQMGWVLIALQNVLWQLLHAPNLEEAVVDTVMRGGDTDTNAAICGALLGAVYGREAVPAQWVECVLKCRPEDGAPGVKAPRPEVFWPADALELAVRLLGETT